MNFSRSKYRDNSGKSKRISHQFPFICVSSTRLEAIAGPEFVLSTQSNFVKKRYFGSIDAILPYIVCCSIEKRVTFKPLNITDWYRKKCGQTAHQAVDFEIPPNAFQSLSLLLIFKSVHSTSVFSRWSFTLHHKRISAFIQQNISCAHVQFQHHWHVYMLVSMSVPSRGINVRTRTRRRRRRRPSGRKNKKFKVNSVVKI